MSVQVVPIVNGLASDARTVASYSFRLVLMYSPLSCPSGSSRSLLAFARALTTECGRLMHRATGRVDEARGLAATRENRKTMVPAPLVRSSSVEPKVGPGKCTSTSIGSGAPPLGDHRGGSGELDVVGEGPSHLERHVGVAYGMQETQRGLDAAEDRDLGGGLPRGETSRLDLLVIELLAVLDQQAPLSPMRARRRGRRS